MKTGTVTPKPGREVTGKTVLICFVGFFGVVATVNGIMMHAAITTFAGTETSSSYKAGLAYREEEAAASGETHGPSGADGRRGGGRSGGADRPGVHDLRGARPRSAG